MKWSLGKAALILMAVPALAGGSARGQSYTGTVLYELIPPSGFYSAGVVEVDASGQAVGTAYTPGVHHASLWNGSGSAVDLNPTGFKISNANGVGGGQQVGRGAGSSTGGSDHALLWNGTAASAVDLNPSSLGFNSSEAYGTNGSQQVGWGDTYYSHALLWNGTAASAVDLNPSGLGFIYSQAFATNGSQQVGLGFGNNGPNESHAILWSGSAASAIDLNPSGFFDSIACGISPDGTQQVGDANTLGSGNYHAMLWTGTAASAIDLNPSSLGITSSEAFASNGSQQVGWGTSSALINNPHAMLWSGTAASAVDLNNLLPGSGNWDSSEAFSIDAAGDVFGFASGTYNGVGDEYAVEWSPVSVPEPTTLGAVAMVATGLLARRRRSISK